MGLSGHSGISGVSAIAGGTSPLLTSLISFWELEEASGTRNDAHGTNHLTDNNTVTQAAGKVGSAGQFTAANSEYLSIADNAALSMGDIDLTVGAWVYLDTIGADRGIVAKWASGNTEYILYVTSGNRARFIVRNAANTADGIISDAFGALTSGTWYFLMGWHDATNDLIGVSVNGVSNTTSHSTGVRDSNAAFEIGRFNGSNYFNGRIDQPFVYKRLLTTTERTWLFNGGAGRSYAEVRAYRG